MKDRYTITEIRKQANRMTFGEVCSHALAESPQHSLHACQCNNNVMTVHWSSLWSHCCHFSPRFKKMHTKKIWDSPLDSWAREVCQDQWGLPLLTRRHRSPFPKGCRYLFMSVICLLILGACVHIANIETLSDGACTFLKSIFQTLSYGRYCWGCWSILKL